MILLPARRGPQRPDESDVAVLMASRLELRRWRDLPRFLVASLRLRRRLGRTPGAMWLRLGAQPWARTFWTMSAWSSHEDLRRFVDDDLHRRVMADFGPVMAGSTFATWTASATTATWSEGLARLADVARAEHSA